MLICAMLHGVSRFLTNAQLETLILTKGVVPLTVPWGEGQKGEEWHPSQHFFPPSSLNILAQQRSLVHTSTQACTRLARPHLAAQLPPSLQQHSHAQKTPSLVCRAAGRPMWAAKEAAKDPPKEPVGDATSRMITRDIGSCNTLQDLEDVCNEWSGSFGCIQAAAALVKYARLSQQLRAKNPNLFKRLVTLWLQVLSDAETHQCANVLWVFGSVGFAAQQVWDSTWAAYIKHMQRDAVVPAQEISSVLWACGKLRQQPTPEELQLLLEAFLQPAVLETAAPQAVSDVALALTQLRQLNSWKAQVSEEQLLLLLGDTQLAALAVNGAPQAVSNVLLSLARLATGDAPVLSFEQHCAKQLLPAVTRATQANWQPQDVSTALLTFAKLRIDTTDSQLQEFMAAVVRSAPRWCPTCNNLNIQQVAYGCGVLGYRDMSLMQQMLQRGKQLLQPPPRSKAPAS